MALQQPGPAPSGEGACRTDVDASLRVSRDLRRRCWPEIACFLHRNWPRYKSSLRSARRSGCSGRGSNPHGILSQGILSPSRLPVSPPERIKRRASRANEAAETGRDPRPNLGKVVLYQLSYSRNEDKATGKWDSNKRPLNLAMDATPNLKLTIPRTNDNVSPPGT